MTERIKGTVIRVIKVRGFGFVLGEDTVERFLHVENFNNPYDWEEIRVGVGLTFTNITTPKGLRCGEVELVAH